MDETPEVYGDPRLDPLTRPPPNGHPKSVLEVEGRWLGLGSDDLRAESKAGGMLTLDCMVCYLPFILPGLE